MMTLRAMLSGFARIIATVTIFSVAGPLAFAVLIFLVVFGLGTPFLELIGDFTNLGHLSPLVSAAVWVLAIVTMLAALPPSMIAGVVFALAAVCAGFSAIWMAWCASGIAIAGILLIGAFHVPDESSAVLLPNIRGVEPVVRAFVGLNVLALLPATFCWWLTRPLHRATGVA